jgi:hypothetical protein
MPLTDLRDAVLESYLAWASEQYKKGWDAQINGEELKSATAPFKDGYADSEAAQQMIEGRKYGNE